MRVLVIGAGIGGLVLAHALRGKGLEAVVFDRDPAAEVTGGYRLRLDQRACAVLRTCLAPRRYEALMASSAGAYRRFHVTDHRMRLLFADEGAPGAEELLIGRIPLRTQLADWLGEDVRFGAEYIGHEVVGGRVLARFADGATATGDVLVGADGVGSRVAAALAGRPTSRPAGVSGIAARAPLTDRVRALLPALLSEGPALAFGPAGVGLFLSVHDPDARPLIADARSAEPAALVWGLLAPDRAYPGGARHLDPAALVRLAATTLTGWHPAVRALVEAADPATAAFFGFHAADPRADLTPWPAGPVTALGDAVHAMPPTGGQAAVTAIRDADVLAGELAAAAAGESTIPIAVHRYHLRLATYAPAALRESLQPLGWVHRMSGPLGTAVARAALPALATAARVGRVVTGVRGA
ncbi:FAD-dependent oxidoreductase [Actinokineospora guangxiensis]|uniref:FAD-dependent oxidoreductase n=1 Tax=Actinokineospora guangxiensis TaxID=1490288 RepID=A0ABW0EKF8_9PSEU